MNMEQAWLLFRRTGLPEAYSLYRELKENGEELAGEIVPPEELPPMPPVSLHSAPTPLSDPR